jgi:hypothetical protein
MTLTNTLELTRTQEDSILSVMQDWFEQTVTSDFWHFSFEGSRLDFKTMQHQVVCETHSDKGSFFVTMLISDKKKGLKRTLKTLDLH